MHQKLVEMIFMDYSKLQVSSRVGQGYQVHLPHRLYQLSIAV